MKEGAQLGINWAWKKMKIIKMLEDKAYFTEW
jgi:hypothetical protein